MVREKRFEDFQNKFDMLSSQWIIWNKLQVCASCSLTYNCVADACGFLVDSLTEAVKHSCAVVLFLDDVCT